MDDFEERKNTGRCVVAIPTATEPIHHLGDAAEPKHLTVLWLGKPEENPGLDMEAVQEAVRDTAEHVGPVTAQVAGQGPLGDEGAQVAFLVPDAPTQLRDLMLEVHPVLSEGVDAVEQFPGYQPHVTLGYDPAETDQVPNDDLPENVIFDRLAVWDGDEHTEYPLGPSASSAETTDVLGPDFEHELVAALTEPITLNSAEDLTAAIAAAGSSCGTAQLASRRILMKRARELGCQYVIPTSWLRQATASATAAAAVTAADVSAVMVRNVSDVPDLFALKTRLSNLSDTALRAAYMRGVRDYTMTAPQSRPPLPRDVIAQARVNSLIRLAQGDISARTDDQDLLP